MQVRSNRCPTSSATAGKRSARVPTLRASPSTLARTISRERIGQSFRAASSASLHLISVTDTWIRSHFMNPVFGIHVAVTEVAIASVFARRSQRTLVNATKWGCIYDGGPPEPAVRATSRKLEKIDVISSFFNNSK